MRRGFITAGCWTIDRIKLIDAWPDEDALSQIATVERLGGGCAHSFGIDMKKLDPDMPVEAIGLLGQDPDGDFLRKRASDAGIDVTQLQQTPDASTPFTDVMTVETTGRRTFFYHPGSNDLLNPAHFNLAKTNGAVLHLGLLGLHKSMDARWDDDPSGWVSVLKEAQALGIRTNVELVSIAAERIREIAWPCLPFLDSLIVNDHEIGGLTGCETLVNGKTDVDACIDAAKQAMQAGSMSIVVVHYPEGAFALERSGAFFQLPSFPVSQRDIKGAVGAGDAFAAGFLYALNERQRIEDALRLAHATAAISLTVADAVGAIRTAEENLAFAKNLYSLV